MVKGWAVRGRVRVQRRPRPRLPGFGRAPLIVMAALAATVVCSAAQTGALGAAGGATAGPEDSVPAPAMLPGGPSATSGGDGPLSPGPVAQGTPVQSPTPTLRDSELRLVSRINDERRAQGRPSLRENLQMTRIARNWSDVMLRQQSLYHNPRLATDVHGPWTRLGENVGRSLLPGSVTLLDRVEHLHGLFMNSAGHRANVLGAWNQVGAGVLQAQDGTMWVTVTFLQGPADAFPLFVDIAGSPHEPAINALWARGIVSACDGGARYCLNRNTTRAEMATFVARTIGLAPQAGNRFSDVSGPHAGYINALAAAGIVKGCAEARFCPDQGVTRAQMATFIVQASPRLSPIPGSRFVDVIAGAVHSDNINALAAARVTLGCTPDRYCPRANVTRGQIASFLARAFPG